MPDVRSVIQAQVRQLVGGGGDTSPLDTGRDAGLFGPDSACWKVHGDFTSMMIGGVAALLLQMLHPGALAGVWDHSNFREDMTGRLKRTARFIAGTTYGSTDQALALIAHVRAVHDRVNGQLADGGAYSAHDPDLLTWVHVAEVSSFLAAYLRYRDPAFSAADQDRYYAETATIAERLGAQGVPKSRAEVREYLRGVRPLLRYDGRTREVAQALLSQTPPTAAMGPFMKLIFEASADLLPDWAARMHGLHVPAARRPAIRVGVRGVGRLVRWALQNGAETRARRRAASLSAAG
jgi:uncharacterized protein (DUF2236 family)